MEQLSREERLKKVEAALALVNKEYGKNTLMKMGDKPDTQIDVIPSGSLLMNDALGVGGWPRGRIVEIYGLESSGKTSLCLHAIAEAQKQGGFCAFLDAEHALDISYAKALGVDVDSLYISQPENGEATLEIADELISSGGFDLVIIDSVAALVPKAELEGDMGDAQMALQARLMSQACRKLTGTISKSNTCLIFTNQIRMAIGGYGNPERVAGGNALKFYASVRVDIRRGDIDKTGEGQDLVIRSIKAKVKIVKNKVAPPFKQCELTFSWGKGLSTEGEVIELAVKYDIIEKAGSWYSYNDERIGQGLESVVNFLKENPQNMEAIEQKVCEKMNIPYKKRVLEEAAVAESRQRKPREKKAEEVVEQKV